MTIRIRDLNDPNLYGSIENVTKTYASAKNAKKAANDHLEAFGDTWDATATIIVTNNAAGRFVPIINFQGNDRAQLCINTARAGFMAFA